MLFESSHLIISSFACLRIDDTAQENSYHDSIMIHLIISLVACWIPDDISTKSTSCLVLQSLHLIIYLVACWIQDDISTKSTSCMVLQSLHLIIILVACCMPDNISKKSMLHGAAVLDNPFSCLLDARRYK